MSARLAFSENEDPFKAWRSRNLSPGCGFVLSVPENKGKSGSYFLSSISGKQREITAVFPVFQFLQAEGHQDLISLLPSPESKGK